MSKRRRVSSGRRVADARFWGSGEAPAGEAEWPAVTSIRPTPDPGALVRSLGTLPLALDGAVAERHLTAVYEEAVRTATALAAASGLLEPDEAP